jgi:NhaP-type Na+/H+ or K+/H+ antiporter
VLTLVLTLVLALLFGKLISKLRLPAILGWLICSMLLGPHALALLPQSVMDTTVYKTIITWMQVSFGLMLGTELIIKKIREYGKALMITTLTPSLGTFFVVSASFAVIFAIQGIPIYLAFAFGEIALATAPAPAFSIVQEFRTKGPVTDTLLPMAILDDIVGIAVFFTVNAFIARSVSGGSIPLYMIPVMIFLPIGIGIATGYPAGLLLRKIRKPAAIVAVLLAEFLPQRKKRSRKCPLKVLLKTHLRRAIPC